MAAQLRRDIDRRYRFQVPPRSISEGRRAIRNPQSAGKEAPEGNRHEKDDYLHSKLVNELLDTNKLSLSNGSI